MKLRKCSQCPNKYSGIANLCEHCKVRQKEQMLGLSSTEVEVSTDANIEIGGVNVYAKRRVGKKKYAAAIRVSGEATKDHGDKPLHVAARYLRDVLTGEGYEQYLCNEGEAMQFIPYPEQIAPVKKTSKFAKGTPVSIDSNGYLVPMYGIIKNPHSNFWYVDDGKADGTASVSNWSSTTVAPLNKEQIDKAIAALQKMPSDDPYPVAPAFALTNFDKDFLPSVGIEKW